MRFTVIKNKIFIFVFLAILVFPWIGGGVLKVVKPDAYKALSLVETEKRQMAEIEWSNLLNTGESISNFVDDRIPFRYTLISWYKALDDSIETKYQAVETAVGGWLYKPTEEAEESIDRGETNKPIVPGEEVIAINWNTPFAGETGKEKISTRISGC